MMTNSSCVNRRVAAMLDVRQRSQPPALHSAGSPRAPPRKLGFFQRLGDWNPPLFRITAQRRETDRIDADA